MSSAAGFAQTNIAGEAPVTLEVRAVGCDTTTRTLDVFIDVDGLMGLGGDAGINGFVLAFDLDSGETFQSALAGEDPMLDWTFVVTEPAVVTATDTLVLVGVVADNAAPNRRYHVASVVFSGPTTEVTISFNAAASSLSSRVIGGDGPGPILIAPPDPITLNLVSLNLAEAAEQWRLILPDYDLVPPFGPLDVRDLVALVNCTTSGP